MNYEVSFLPIKLLNTILTSMKRNNQLTAVIHVIIKSLKIYIFGLEILFVRNSTRKR